MRKIGATILSLFALTACVFTATAGVFEKDFAVVSAQETATIRAQNTGVEEENGLIVPQTYEEYLLLNEPSCVAVCENFTAIADGNLIYVYDRVDGVYKTYTHGTGAAQDNVKKMQFWGGNILYFADNATGDNFYKLHADTLETATEIDDIACGTFLIAGDDLYFTNSSGSLYSTTLQDAENDLPKTSLLWENVSSLAYWGEELYFVHSDFYLHKINPHTVATPDASKTLFASLPQVASSIAITEGVFSYTTASGGFYALALNDLPKSSETQTLHFSTGLDGYKNVYPFGEKTYVVQSGKGIVKEYSTSEKAFTSFEISSDSAATHRLSGGTDVALYQDKLYIADNGNRRLSVYDSKTQALTVQFPLSTECAYLSTDGNHVLTAATTTALLYDLQGEGLAFDGFNGKICGVASVYGVHYIVTEDNYFYALVQDDTGVWQKTEVKKTSTHPPQMLTADAYGNLYIKSGAYAYSFTEETFMQADGNGTRLVDNLPTETKKIAVDYDGNLYALTDSVLKYQKQTDGSFTQAAVDVSEQFVFGNAPTLTSIAFGIEKNVTYLLCNGNYVVQTKNLQLPTVTAIPVQDADESIFAKTEATFEIVKTQKNALLIAFDIKALQGADVFPYQHYYRSSTEKTALKIGEDVDGKYNLVAHFDKQTSKYSTYLVLKSACETLPSEEYRVEYAQAEQKSAWLTNELSLYKFPYLCDKLVVVERLPRGGEVTLLGEIGELDHAYYHIAYVDENGERKTGYIPQSYATLSDASPKESTTTLVGERDSNHDSVWRLSYILLGFGAVCILVDFLLLRKKKQDDE